MERSERLVNKEQDSCNVDQKLTSRHRQIACKLKRTGSDCINRSRQSSKVHLNLPVTIEDGNLILLKNSSLGKSAPNISTSNFNERIVIRKTSFNKFGRTSICIPNLQKSHPSTPSAREISEPFWELKSNMMQQLQNLGRRSSLFSNTSSDMAHVFNTNNSSQDCSINDDNFHSFNNCESSDQIKLDGSFRLRCRSMSSSLHNFENDIVALNAFYRERFPKAIKEMEMKLNTFIDKNKATSASLKCDGTASFVVLQLVQLAANYLEKSRNQLLTTDCFTKFTNDMYQLLENASTRGTSSIDYVVDLIQELLIIISRSARLLECLEFNPEDFYRQMEEAEGEARHSCTTDVVSYIISKLGLDKITLENNESIDGKLKMEDNYPLEEKMLPSKICENDFESLKLISNGAYGAVILVRHKKSHKVFAMKKLLKSNLVLRNLVEQVFTERNILTFIDNPFVVSFYCCFETKRHLCMVLEYVEGGDCAALLKNIGGPLPPDMARLYFAETVLALEYLHSFGIVHRDLKPDNLLITSLGHIKLTDFGLSKIGLMKMTTNLYEGAQDFQQFVDKQMFGTPEYIAPEVIYRQGYGKPVDWWSMGIILYQFLVGCVPFMGDSPEEVFIQILNGEIEWPDEEEFSVSTIAKDLILQLLDRDPNRRLGTIGAIQIKQHIWFEMVNWNGLLRQKAEFVPQLSGDDDTSYFDTRRDRYNHDLSDDSEIEESEDAILFHSFSTCSPRYSSNALTSSFEDGEPSANSQILYPNLNKDSPEKISEPKNLKSKKPVSRISKIFKQLAIEANPVSTDSGCPSPDIGEKNRSKKGYKFSSKRIMKNAIPKSASASSLHTINNNQHLVARQISRDSSVSSFDDPIDGQARLLTITRSNQVGFGFNIRASKIFNPHTQKSMLQHIIYSIDKTGPANETGLNVGDMVTHVNNKPVVGLPHSDVVKLILLHSSVKCATLTLRVIATHQKPRNIKVIRRISSRRRHDHPLRSMNARAQDRKSLHIPSTSLISNSSGSESLPSSPTVIDPCLSMGNHLPVCRTSSGGTKHMKPIINQGSFITQSRRSVNLPSPLASAEIVTRKNS